MDNEDPTSRKPAAETETQTAHALKLCITIDSTAVSTTAIESNIINEHVYDSDCKQLWSVRDAGIVHGLVSANCKLPSSTKIRHNSCGTVTTFPIR